MGANLGVDAGHRVSHSVVDGDANLSCLWRGIWDNKVSEGAAIAAQIYLQGSGDRCSIAMLT